MDLGGTGGHQHGQGGKAGRAQALDSSGAAREIEGVAQRGSEDKGAAHQHRTQIGGEMEVMGEGQADAQIGNGQGGHLPPFQALAEKDHGNEHGEGGIGEQDEPFQPGGNVAQAVEIQQAGTVVAEYAQGREFEPFPGA